MISTERKIRLLGLLVPAALSLLGVDAMAAGALAVDSVSVSAVEGGMLVNIFFTCPNRYIEVQPQGASNHFEITMMRLDQCDALHLGRQRQEVDLPGDRSEAAVRALDYEPKGGSEALLRIRFESAVHATVSQAPDLRSLAILVDTGAGRLAAGESAPETPAVDDQDGSMIPAKGEPAAVALGDLPLTATQIESLLAEGEAAFLAGNYDRAIQVYTRVLRAPAGEHTPKALELLGLSRERNGQTAQAVNEYRRYLESYPNNEGAPRVEQRLAGLVTAHRETRPDQAASAATPDASPWDVYGGISQYYRRDVFDAEGQDSFTAQSSILTNADLLFQRQGERYQFSGRATLGNLWDLLGGDEGPGNDTRLYQGYVELADDTTLLSGRIGRQTLRTSGVLGRFDGLHLAWEFRPGMRFNLLGGYPVYTTSDGFDNDRDFYGAAVDFEDVAQLFDISFYYNHQQVDGVDNREAVGAEVHHFDDTKSLIALFDYDIDFGKLANLTVMGNWTVLDSLTLSGSIDHRTSPYLTTESALIGQPAETIEELLLFYSEDEIRQMAEDRSGEVTSYRLGASQTLSERFQLNADVTVTEFDESVTAGIEPGVPEQGTQYYYSMDLVGSRLLADGDTHILGLRYIDGDNASTTSLQMDSRFPLSRQFQLNPRLRISRRDSQYAGADAWITSPSLRFVYRIGRRYRLDFEAGNQRIDQKSSANAIDRSFWFLYCGYRADF